MPGEFDDDVGGSGLTGPVGDSGGEVPAEHLAPNRRTFLKAAVLGAGAAAVGKQFLPLSAYAHDATALNCTANDVRIIGPGIILNEPCNCPIGSTFTAQVQFTVENNAAAERHCITLHLCPTTVNGTTIGGDFNVGTIPGKTTVTRTVNIPNYPCGAGTVCFGGRGSQADGSFLKGEACPEPCCSTISWDVGQLPADCAASALDPIPSKCRHQQICIQGRGTTTIDCDTSTAGLQTTCEVACNTSTTIRLCTTGGPGPYTFTLRRDSATGTVVGGPVTQAGLCRNFTVGPLTQSTTFCGTVTDATGCAKTACVTINVRQPTATITVTGNTNCNGNLTLGVSVPGFTGCTVTWKEGTTVLGTSSTLSYRVLDGVCHTITAEVNCGGCTATATRRIRQCVQTTLDCAVS